MATLFCMASVTIEVPDDVSDIPAAMASLKKQMAAVNAQRKAIQGAMEAVQSACPHPNLRRGFDYDGGSNEYCPTCGYSG